MPKLLRLALALAAPLFLASCLLTPGAFENAGKRRRRVGSNSLVDGHERPAAKRRRGPGRNDSQKVTFWLSGLACVGLMNRVGAGTQ